MNSKWQTQEIDWAQPQPRHGILGTWDRFVGPGATAAELWLSLAAALAGVAAVAVHAFQPTTTWSLPQSLLAIILAFDLAGGVVTNATVSATHWYHRPG